jgi:hypothetical protein
VRNQREPARSDVHDVTTITHRAAEGSAQRTNAGAQRRVAATVLRPGTLPEVGPGNGLAVVPGQAAEQGEMLRRKHNRARRTCDPGFVRLNQALPEPELPLKVGGVHDLNQPLSFCRAYQR